MGPRGNATFALRFSPVATAILLLATTTVTVPGPAAAADEQEPVRTEAPTLAAPAAPPPPLGGHDRLPVLAAPEDGLTLDESPPLELQPGVSIEDVPGIDLRPAAGGPTLDAFATKRRAVHGGVVYPDKINVSTPEGQWIRALSRPRETDRGWIADFSESSVHFPSALGAGAGITFRTAGREITFSLERAGRSEGGMDEATLRYPGVLAHTDARYRITPHGYKEELVLTGPQAPGEVSYLIDAGGLSLVAQEDGTFSFSVGGRVVAVIPTPVAYDSSPGFRDSVPRTTLTDLGGGKYQLRITLDPTFLQEATYPVVLDPGSVTPYPSRDTWVNQDQPSTSFEGSNILKVGGGRRTFIRFDVTGLIKTDRLVYDAQLNIHLGSQNQQSVEVNARRPIEPWPASMTWNNQPAVADTIYGSDTAPAPGWLEIQLASLYQQVLEGTLVGRGVRLSSQDEKALHSSEADPSRWPTLTLVWNDLPSAPSLQSPGADADVETDSPTLVASSTDPNGDPVMYRYQVSSSSTTFSGPDLVWDSGWTDESRHTVPPGILYDGDWWWRVQARDLCDDEKLCPLTGGGGVTRSTPTSAVRKMTTSLSYLGDDDRYATWVQDLGNDMELKVNQANGNLMLDVPFDSLTTPSGDLELGLSYNHQQDRDSGITPGWDLQVGQESLGGLAPTELTEVSVAGIPSGEMLALWSASGTRTLFTKSSEGMFTSPGRDTSTIYEASDGTHELVTASGEGYTFDPNGDLDEATPAATVPGEGGYTYSFAGGNLTRVTDPMGRGIDLTWSGGLLEALTTWDGRIWDLSYQGAHLQAVKNPGGEMVTFAYDASGLLTEVRDGQQSFDAVSGWRVVYGAAPGDPMALPRVQQIHPPVPTGATWRFDYTGPFTGTVAAQTMVTDPRGVESVELNDYQTRTDFSPFALPIRISGPAYQHGYWPQLTKVWDSNGNILCARSPEANAVDEGCTASLGTWDELSSVFSYEDHAPYLLVDVQHPSAEPSGGADRAEESFQYDEALTGLWARIYENSDLSGSPVEERVWGNLDDDWGSGGPPGLNLGDDWAIRWSGTLLAEETRIHGFRATASSGDAFRLSIDQATVLDCPFGGPCQSEGERYLAAGPHQFTFEFREDQGLASFNVQWDEGFGWQVMDSSLFKPELNLVTTQEVGGLQLVNEFPSQDALAQGLAAAERSIDPESGEVQRTETSYDSFGREEAELDFVGTPEQALTDYTYKDDPIEETSCLVQITDPNGQVLQNECDPTGETLQITEQIRAVGPQPAQERVMGTEYDEVGREDAIWDNAGGRADITYDRAGRPLVEKTLINDGGTPNDPQDDVWAVVANEYDDGGRLVSTTGPDPDGDGPKGPPVVGYAYDAAGNTTARTDARGKIWKTLYDAHDRVIAEITPLGLVTATDYELVHSGSYFNRITVTDPSGVKLVTTYDVLDRPITQKEGSLEPTRHQYDEWGNVIRTADPAGIWLEKDYDGFGRVTEERTPHKDPGETWSGDQLVTPVADPPGGSAGFVSDTNLWLDDPDENAGTPPSKWPAGARRVEFDVTTTTSLGGSSLYVKIRDLTEQAYVAQRVIEVEQTDSMVETLTFDAEEGKSYQAQVSMDGPMNVAIHSIRHEPVHGIATTTYDYDSAGNLIRTDGPRTDVQDIFQYQYDLSGRMTRVIQVGIQAPNATDFVYDDSGLPMKTIDPDGRVREWTYDEAGREQTFTDALGTTTNHYNVAGELIRQDDPRGLSLRFRYDLAGRQIRRWAEDAQGAGAGESFTYDPAGNRISALAEESDVQTHFSYDDDGRLIQVDQEGALTTYSYDNPVPGKLSSVSDPEGGITAYSYDQNGFLKTLTDPLSGAQTNYAYDPQSGRFIGRTDPTGLVWTRGYDFGGRPDSQDAVGPGGTVASFELSYDLAGNVVAKSQFVNGAPAGENGSWTYEYDGANRLVSATDPGAVTTLYGYDGAGNRTSIKEGSAPAVITTFDGAGLPASSSDGNTYTHDEVGSLTGMIGPGPDWTFGYDAWGRLESVGGSSSLSYRYDALGRVVERSEGTVITGYRYIGDSENLSGIGSGSTGTRYAIAPDGPLAQEANGAIRFLLPDMHKDVVGMVDLNGEITGATTYSPWGEERASSGEPTRFGFQGNPTDPATGLVDVVNRIYAPSLGRFTSRDPLFGSAERPTSLNQYAYGENNPVSRIDPLGLFTYLVCGRGGTYQACRNQMNDEFKPNFRRWMREKGGYSETFRVFPYSRDAVHLQEAARRLYGRAKVKCPEVRRNSDPCNAIGHSLGGAVVARAASFGGIPKVFDFIMTLDVPWKSDFTWTDPCGRWNEVPDFRPHPRTYWINLYIKHTFWRAYWGAPCADRNERLEQIDDHGGFWRNNKVARIGATAVCTMRRRMRGYPPGTCHV